MPTLGNVIETRDGQLPGSVGAHRDRPDVEIVIPVYNEEQDLAPSVRRLHQYLGERFPFSYRLTIADNASTDRTREIAEALAAELPGVAVVHLAEKGRGRALRAVWSASDARVLAYMDVDLSTDLAALLPLVAPLLSGHSDVAIGSRLSRSARVSRGPKRELISRCSNLILRTTLGTRFSDAQCGFKAIRADRAAELLPLIEDTGWFFDTELLVLAEAAGMRIHEVPVDWVDDPDSRVDIIATAIADLRGIARLGRGLAAGAIPVGALRRHRLELAGELPGVPPRLPGQLVRFAAIGAASTLAYLVLFLGLRDMGLAAQPANALALVTTAVANTAANRRLTFGVRGRSRAAADHIRGLLVFALGLALTSGALAGLHGLAPGASRMPELAVLVGANLLATVLRFVLFRSWIFRSARGPAPGPVRRDGADLPGPHLTLTTTAQES
ncbi:MAG TPA: bifunctional glycosyltransferase family 2/GtrA family protein [Mycobacteriales bacterium]|nr:bifunctional glycosyltransferase family 2/GtrA family protein [Mycobacteriales bacterium]